VEPNDVTPTTGNDAAVRPSALPLNLARLTSALTLLDPDCGEKTWSLRRLAPLAEAAGTCPELEEELYELARSWSSGALRGIPSKKWRCGGRNGRTGEEVFDRVWIRFLHSRYRGTPTTIGTIFFDAVLAGWNWVDPEDRFEIIDDEVEGCAQ